jgi:hypothetical protein
MTTATHRYLSEAQVKLLTDMINERFEQDDDEGREQYRKAWHQINSREDFNQVLALLRNTPTLRQRSFATRPRPTLVSEPGYYRNPEDGTLWRIVEHTDTPKWGPAKKVFKVARYSKTGGPRRLDVRGNHLPHSEAAAREVLLAQGIDPDAFLAEHAGTAQG